MQLTKTGHTLFLRKSLDGAKKAGRIWSTVLNGQLTAWGFQPANVERRMDFQRFGQANIILVVVVVDDKAFASNDTSLKDLFNQKMKSILDVKLYGEL